LAAGDLEAADAALAPGFAHTPDAKEAHALGLRIALAAGDLARMRRHTEALPAAVLVDEGLLPIAVALVVPARLARNLAEAAVAVRPDQAIAWVALSDAQLRAGDPDAAHAAMRRAVSLRNDPDAWLIRRARIAWARQDADGAMALLRRALDADPVDGRPLRLYALLASERDHPTLRADIERMVRRTHEANRPWGMLAAATHQIDPEMSRHAAHAGAARDCPALAPPRDQLCELWHLAVGGEDLRSVRTRLARLGTTGPEVEDARALMWSRQGQRESAIEAAHRATELAPGDPMLSWIAELMTHRREPSPPALP